jgi:hypothetical protein
MTPDQLAALKSEVQADPQGLGYAQHLPDAPGMVCELLNAVSTSMVKSRLVSARAVLAECGSGAAAILDKLDAASANISSVKWAMKFLQQEGGLDVGHPVTQAQLDALAAGGVLTQAEADALKNMAVQPASRAEKLALGTVTEADLRDAGVTQ